ncbi:MAG: hypothetical protein JWN92_1240 [Candidatus Acidoferrum typicum]|nr:hypothetical protein [Candidatus Acidoferrum typicum]
MKSKEKIMSVCSLTKVFRGKEVIRFAVGISVALALAGPAFAQYGGGGAGMGGGTGTGTTGTATPSYGTSGKAIGIGVGAAAGGAAVLYLALHHAGSVTGCVQSGNDGLTIVDDKNKTYRIMPGGADLVPGERVELRGKKSPAGATGQSFQPKKLVKNLGSCGSPSASTDNLSHSASATSAHDFPQQ